MDTSLLMLLSITLGAFAVSVKLSGLERRPIWVELATGLSLLVMLIGILGLTGLIDSTTDYTAIRLWMSGKS